MTVGVRSRSSASWRGRPPALLPAIGVLVIAGLALYLAWDAGVRHWGALPDLARGVLAAAALFAVGGEAVTRVLLPRALAPFRWLLVLPIGAFVSALALTILGFLHAPIELSIGLVLAGGIAASTLTRSRTPLDPVDRVTPAWAVVAALIVALALIPSFRAGFPTVPGTNPDAHLVAGTAVFLQHAPPTAHRLGLPVTQMPLVWRSKYPIFYSLAAVSKLSGMDPIAVFPAEAGLLLAFVALGFGLVATSILGVSTRAASVVVGVVGLNAALLYLAFHPYWNQLWGMAAFPFALVFGWFAIADRDPRAVALLALTLVLAALAYPLMLPYPLFACVAFAIVLRRLPVLPRWLRSRWSLAVALPAIALAVPLFGVLEKVSSASSNLVTGAHLWQGDVLTFFPLGFFVSTGGGFVPFLAVAALAAFGLLRLVPRPQAMALGLLLGTAAIADLWLRRTATGTYFDFKHLSFVGLVLVALAAATVGWLLSQRRTALVVGGALTLALYAGLDIRQVRNQLARNHDQVSSFMLGLREWSRAIPRDASVRLDIPPSGYQLWGAYFFAAHPLNAPFPVLTPTYPRVAYGAKADYSLSLSPSLTAALAGSGSSYRRPHDLVGPPVRESPMYVLRRLAPQPGPDTATRKRFQATSIPLT